MATGTSVTGIGVGLRVGTSVEVSGGIGVGGTAAMVAETDAAIVAAMSGVAVGSGVGDGVGSGVGVAVGRADATTATMVASRSRVGSGSLSPPVQASAPTSSNTLTIDKPTNFKNGSLRRITSPI